MAAEGASSSFSSLWEKHKPALAMVAVQFIYAAMALSAKAAFTEGMSPMVFVVYRQAIATLLLAPITFITSRRSKMRSSSCINEQNGMGVRGFGLVFLAALVGATCNQFLYYQGMKLASSSMATAMTNLIPAITFVMAASLGLEQVKMSVRSMAKVAGTLMCVGGAMTMAFFKGPRLLSMELLHHLLSNSASNSSWLMGSLFLIASASCWSFWLILQVPICKNHMTPLSLSTWMCFMSSIQSAILTCFLQPDLGSWKITSFVQLFGSLFAGIFGSGVTFYLQSWSISVRGPLFSALFNPLSTVITTIMSFLILHEKLHLGSLIGGAVVVGGLYIVLWGKSKDFEHKKEEHPIDKSGDKLNIVVVDGRGDDHLKKPLIEETLDDDNFS